MSESQTDPSERFVPDVIAENVPAVLDTQMHEAPARVVVTCKSDEQAERIAALLNREFATNA